MQVRILTAGGELRRGSFSDIDQSAQAALNGAKWNVDPSRMTPELMPAWTAVEFGNFAPAATLVKRHLKSRKAATKTAATALNDYVIEKLNAEVDRANAAEDSDDLWTAYKTLSTVTVQFKGYEISPDVKSKIAELERDESIKAELAAQKQMTLVRRVLNSSSAAARKRAELMLEKITNDFPGTEAATEAETLLTPM